MKIAHVSTFPPMECGIACFVEDLIESLPQGEHLSYPIGRRASVGVVSGAVDVDDKAAVAALARRISASGANVLSLQHEFGIWGGGHAGPHLLDFLDGLSLPLVSTLHTLPFEPGGLRVRLLEALVDRSVRLIVLTEAARRQLQDRYGVAAERIILAPHGVPQPRPAPPLPVWQEAHGGEPLRIACVGFIRREKGLQAALVALWLLKRAGMSFRCTIAGSDPARSTYNDSAIRELHDLVAALDLEAEVAIVHGFLPRDEMAEIIGRHHLGLCAYQDATQVSSGMIPTILALGRPVVCTPFDYALDLRRNCRAVRVAPSFGADALARALTQFARLPEEFPMLVDAAQAFTRNMAWNAVGETYWNAFAAAVPGRAEPAP